MFPQKVCQSGSFNRWTTSRPILSFQLNCVRFKLQDSSSDSQSNLDQRKEERELLAAEQALLAAVSSRHIKIFAGVVKPARFCRRPAPALLRRRSNSVTPMDGLWTSSNDKARLYCPRRTVRDAVRPDCTVRPCCRPTGAGAALCLCPLHSHRPPFKSRAVPPSVSSAPPHQRFQALLRRRSRL